MVTVVQHINVTNVTELYIQKWFKKQILCYMYFTTIKNVWPNLKLYLFPYDLSCIESVLTYITGVSANIN